jgi:hypothetical protein
MLKWIVHRLLGIGSAAAATATVALHTDVQPGHAPWRNAHEPWPKVPALTYYAPRSGPVEPVEEPADEWTEILAQLSRDQFRKAQRLYRAGYFDLRARELVAA